MTQTATDNQVATNGAEIRPIWASTPEVLQILGVSRGTLSYLQRDPNFPKPIKLGYKLLRWNIAEIAQWVEEQEKNASTDN